jgi:hypothetical protein
VALLPAARHAPHREAPEATLRAVSDFVRRAIDIDCLGQRSAPR